MEDSSVDRAERQLKQAIVVCTLFMVCEVIGGIKANSLAILTDAGHLLSDLVGFFISLFCLWLAKSKRPTTNLTFGFKRAEVIGAVLSVSLIWIVTIQLVLEAVARTQMILNHDPAYKKVDGKLMFALACVGLSCNLLMMKLLGGHGHSHFGDAAHAHHHDEEEEEAASSTKYGAVSSHGHSHDNHNHSHDNHNHTHQAASPPSSPRMVLQRKDSILAVTFSTDDEHEEHEASNINVETAYIHALGDMLQSVGVLIAASLIWAFPDSHYIELCDPFTTLLFSVLVVMTTVSILKTAINVLMQGVPQGISAYELKQAIDSVDGVLFAYDLHVWSLSINDNVLSVHIVVADGKENEEHEILRKVKQMLRQKFGIKHTTCQIETATFYESMGQQGNCVDVV